MVVAASVVVVAASVVVVAAAVVVVSPTGIAFAVTLPFPLTVIEPGLPIAPVTLTPPPPVNEVQVNPALIAAPTPYVPIGLITVPPETNMVSPSTLTESILVLSKFTVMVYKS